MFGLVLKSSYDKVVSQLVVAEARIRQFEQAAKEYTEAQLAEANAKARAKTGKKIEVKDGDGETAVEEPVSKTVRTSAPNTGADDRKERAKSLRGEGKSVKEIATELGVAESTIYAYLK
jgi:DNA-binding NarL/FixJ family response regulator